MDVPDNPYARPSHYKNREHGHLCTICREEFEDLAAFAEHWEDAHEPYWRDAAAESAESDD